MSTTNAINLSELDASTLKTSLIAYLQTQPIFKDYNYDGSNISTLLDLLAANGSLHAFLLNMVVNESFLDSAQIRDSVVSKAKELNYVPRSWRSPEAFLDVDITVKDAAPSIVTIPSGTSFSSRVDDSVYTFSTVQDISSVPTQFVPATNSYVYSFSAVSIFEGELVTETFVVDNTVDLQRFVLSNAQIDTQSIDVKIAPSNTVSTAIQYTAADTLLNVNKDSTVYFVQASGSDLYEIVFGDGILGVKPSTGNIITVTYRVTAGPAANDANLFTLISPSIGGFTTYTIETNDVARGGAVQESIDSIKYNAPRHYQTQGSAISVPSYKTLIQNQFPEIRSINVYGGEDAVPPRYGYVIISVDLANFDGVPTAKKAAIASFIKPKMVGPFTPEVIDADYLKIAISLSVQYSLSLSSKTEDDIKTILVSAISAYNDANLGVFDAKFRSSKLGTAIDDADPSITGQNLKIQLFREILPTLNSPFRSALDYQNPIVAGSIFSTPFTFNSIAAFINDDGLGNLNISTTTAAVTSALTSPIGTVNYTTGLITISNLTVSEFVGDSIKLYVTPVDEDLTAVQNTILEISLADLDIPVTAVRT